MLLYGLYTFVALSLYYENINTCTKTGWILWRAAPKGFLSRSYRAVFPVHKIDISSCFRNQNVYCLLDYDVSMSLTKKYKRRTYDLHRVHKPYHLWFTTYSYLLKVVCAVFEWALWYNIVPKVKRSVKNNKLIGSLELWFFPCVCMCFFYRI